jgi:hypothetical protein
MLVHVRSGYFRLGQIRSSYVRLAQVFSDYARLSVYVRIGQVSPG